MTPEEAMAMLEKAHGLSLATIGPDGYPHLVAMSYGLDNGDIVMTSYGKAQKVVNLRRNPRAAIMVESGIAYDKLKGVMVRGRAEIIEGADAVIAAMRVVVAHTSGAAASQAAASIEISDGYRRQAAKRVVIRIHPETWASWDHSKLAPGAH
jgi:PPOX class probable F420-dependent enzyme